MFEADVTDKLNEARDRCQRVMDGIDLVLLVPTEERLRTDSGEWLNSLENVFTILVGVRKWAMLQKAGAAPADGTLTPPTHGRRD